MDSEVVTLYIVADKKLTLQHVSKPVWDEMQAQILQKHKGDKYYLLEGWGDAEWFFFAQSAGLLKEITFSLTNK